VSAREYAKLGPTFWTGKTGKEIKRRGSEGVVVALYLLSSPHSNMLGLYYQPKLYMAHETGLGIEGASKGLQICIEAGFCAFDEASEMVWVFEMAAYQVAERLASTDKRCKGIQKDYDSLTECPFLGPFFERYVEAFHLTGRRDPDPENFELGEGPYQAPSKPHRSQEQEQEQEQESKPPGDKPLRIADLEAEGIDRQVARDWLEVRRAKKAPLTVTAWQAVKREAAVAGLTPAKAVAIAAERGWQGFKASWLKDGPAAAASADVFAGAK
jgi:hypothetical protein